MFSVLIITDIDFLQDCLSKIIWKNSDYKVIGCVINGKEAVEICNTQKPDVVLMYLKINSKSEYNTIKKIKAVNRKIKILVFSFSGDKNNIILALKYGADGYVINDDIDDLSFILAKAINRTKYAYESYIRVEPKSLTDQNQNADTYMKVHLTEREKEVLKLVVEGLSNYEIAVCLEISVGRARNIVADLMMKCMVKNRTQLAVFAVREQLVE